MTLVNWYRQSQKQMLLQRVLSHSLAHIVRIYPRYVYYTNIHLSCDSLVLIVFVYTGSARHSSSSTR